MWRAGITIYLFNVIKHTARYYMAWPGGRTQKKGSKIHLWVESSIYEKATRLLEHVTRNYSEKKTKLSLKPTHGKVSM